MDDIQNENLFYYLAYYDERKNVRAFVSLLKDLVFRHSVFRQFQSFLDSSSIKWMQ